MYVYSEYKIISMPLLCWTLDGDTITPLISYGLQSSKLEVYFFISDQPKYTKRQRPLKKEVSLFHTNNKYTHSYSIQYVTCHTHPVGKTPARSRHQHTPNTLIASALSLECMSVRFSPLQTLKASHTKTYIVFVVSRQTQLTVVPHSYT